MFISLSSDPESKMSTTENIPATWCYHHCDSEEHTLYSENATSGAARVLGSSGQLHVCSNRDIREIKKIFENPLAEIQTEDFFE